MYIVCYMKLTTKLMLLLYLKGLKNMNAHVLIYWYILVLFTNYIYRSSCNAPQDRFKKKKKYQKRVEIKSTEKTY